MTRPLSSLRTLLRPVLAFLVLFTVLTGVCYPLAVTGLGRLLFPAQARGSLVSARGHVVASSLVGQHFHSPGYFWGRPSATSPTPYNALGSTGSNLGPRNPALATAVRERIVALQAADPGNRLPIPVDLVTASGSGLDPHITPAAALYQVGRVARARGLSVEAVRRLVAAHTEGRTGGVLGEPRVHVVSLNLSLDALPRPGA